MVESKAVLNTSTKELTIIVDIRCDIEVQADLYKKLINNLKLINSIVEHVPGGGRITVLFAAKEEMKEELIEEEPAKHKKKLSV